jgi:hypothetical protein
LSTEENWESPFNQSKFLSASPAGQISVGVNINCRQPHLMKPDECPNPVDVGCFRAQAVVLIPDAFPHALQKTLSMDGAAG